MKPSAGDSLAVFGVGAVGIVGTDGGEDLAGCDPIIAVDIHDHRLALARELGATHVINHKACGDVVGEICKITGGGARYTVRPSAEPKVFREAIDCLMHGRNLCAARQRAARHRRIVRNAIPAAGPFVRGVVQGDSIPQEFIPRLVDLIVEKKFPIEKMITFYDLPTSTGRQKNRQRENDQARHQMPA